MSNEMYFLVIIPIFRVLKAYICTFIVCSLTMGEMQMSMKVANYQLTQIWIDVQKLSKSIL